MDTKKPLSLNSGGSNILKLLLKIAFVVCMAFVVAGLGKFYSYFKVGADATDLLSRAKIESSIHDPIYHWNIENSKEGILLDEYTRQQVQDAYTSAWYIMNKSMAQRKDLGLSDQFSKRMIEKIVGQWEQPSNIQEERVDLEHDIDVHLFSYDRQLLSFTDRQVPMVRKLKHVDKEESTLVYDKVSFDVVMGLEDGYWKIFELMQLPKEEKIVVDSSKVKEQIALPTKISGVNYYPSEYPWLDFWQNYDSKIIDQDLLMVKELEFNHLRVFLPYAVFGKGTLDETMVAHLDDLVDRCHDQLITLTLTLFDFPESYDMLYYASTRKHLLQLLERYEDKPAAVLWDLKNEPDLDFAHYGEDVVIDWLDFMIKTVREHAPSVNLTIGWSDVRYAQILADELDVLSFHIYKDLDDERTRLRKLKQKTGHKPLYVSEFGRTSYQSTLLPFGSTEIEQAIYTSEVLDLMRTEDIHHYAVWCLNDFVEAPSEIVGWKPWIQNTQARMGLISVDGILKPVSKNFGNNTKTDFQLGWKDRVKPFYIFVLLVGLLLFSFARKWFA